VSCFCRYGRVLLAHLYFLGMIFQRDHTVMFNLKLEVTNMSFYHMTNLCINNLSDVHPDRVSVGYTYG